jgi:hypothetical protein
VIDNGVDLPTSLDLRLERESLPHLSVLSLGYINIVVAMFDARIRNTLSPEGNQFMHT